MSVCAEQRLFSRGVSSILHFERTYERATCEIPRLCFLDCVLMFGKDGDLVEDDAVRSPRGCHSYQVFGFDLMGEDESEGDANAANERLLKFPSSTWRGNLGSHF